MKIVTVNLPDQDVKKIEGMVGNEKYYPSRSELIRVAVRDYILYQVSEMQKQSKEKQKAKVPIIKTKMISPNLELVTFPIPSTQSGTKSYKTYKIIKNVEGQEETR